ncbi:MAG TPA: NAD(P)H-dependent oxidoreductase [Negativicutes bacterium]|jgi:multimeric flavodoxin WrbA
MEQVAGIKESKYVFKTIEKADAILLGAPIYLGRVSGEMCSFLDRLLFQYVPYTNPLSSFFPKSIPFGFIYTMNVPEETMKEMGFDRHIAFNENFLQVAFGSAEALLSFDTLQFEDYSKVAADLFDPAAKAKRRKEEFPIDCQKAFELGIRLVGGQG